MRGAGSGLRAGGAARRVLQVAPEPLQVGSVVVADAAQPVVQPGRSEPVGLVLAGEPGQEPQRDRGVDVAEQPDRAGEGDLQVRAELVGHRDPGGDQVLAGAHRHPQRDRGLAVPGQRPQPGSVGAQHVGQDVGVERVVLVAGRAVAAAQVLQLLRCDHHHREVGVEQRLDHRPVRALDRDLDHPGPAQPRHQLAQPGQGVGDGEPVLSDRRGRRRWPPRGLRWPSRPPLSEPRAVPLPLGRD